MLKKLDRQNQIISLIQQGHTMNASELAQHLNVSIRTISRDIVDLENQGVQIYAHKGKNGGYQIQKSEDKIKLNFTEQQLLSLYLTLIESQSYSTLPYTNEIQSIINQIINIPNTRVRKSLNQMTNLIKFEDTEQITLPHLFADILIYSSERNVMLIDFIDNQDTIAENVIFIGLLCRNGEWLSIIYEIGLGRTRELPVLDIYDISYSFEKTIKTYDISIDNYTQFLNPIETTE